MFALGVASNANAPMCVSPELMHAEFTHEERIVAWGLLEAALAPIKSIHTPVQGLEEVSFEEALADEGGVDVDEALDQSRLTGTVRELLAGLAPRERTILSLRFGLSGEEPATLGQIGEQLGLSRERVRQLESAALARLRERARDEGLGEVLELIA